MSGAHDSSYREATRTIQDEKSAIEHNESSLPATDVGTNDEKLTENVDPIAALNDPNWQDLEKKVVRRLDMTLLPMLWILYLFNYLDRT